MESRPPIIVRPSQRLTFDRDQSRVETFAIWLHGGRGGMISKQQLSEGEKQIFAVSVLWGLARASARPLPAVIDTPTARLDTTHRDHLIERYFPNASHQAVILSTDTEVGREKRFSRCSVRQEALRKSAKAGEGGA